MSLLVAPSSSYQRGYLLIEIAVAISLVLGTVLLSFKGIDYYKDYLAKVQLRAAANIVVSDLIYLQQKSLFDGDMSSYKMDTERNGYIIKSSKSCIKKVDFAQIGCSNVYFNQYSVRIAFSNNGRPKGTYNLEIRHGGLKDVYYIIDIEPVTGRVVLHEKK